MLRAPSPRRGLAGGALGERRHYARRLGGHHARGLGQRRRHGFTSTSSVYVAAPASALMSHLLREIARRRLQFPAPPPDGRAAGARTSRRKRREPAWHCGPSDLASEQREYVAQRSWPGRTVSSDILISSAG
jgi:hypothetical protein